MWWPGGFRKVASASARSRVRMRPLAEAMEPRILYSADMAGGLFFASNQTPVAEHRTLNGGGEYVAPPVAATASPKDIHAIRAAYLATPLSFENNEGQADSHVDFISRGSGYGIALSGQGVELKLGRDGSFSTVQMTLDGGSQTPTAQPENLLAAGSNYLIGNNPSSWLTGISNYGAVAYQNVYNGVDVVYYGTQRQLEYDFHVKPGADATQINLRFSGAQASVDPGGDLLLAVDGRQEVIRFKAPVSYQDGPMGREAVASSYQIRDNGSIGFVLGAYDQSRLLVIDPVLDYASYFGTAGTESALGVAVDSTGAVYITGRTTTSMGLNIGSGGSGDVYVAKFSADLSTLIYSTRIGGAGDDQGNSIAVDNTGNASVTGWTQSSDFPTVAASQGTLSGSQDAFIFRLNAAGSGLAFSTFLGGLSSTDTGSGIAVDGSGNVYATGQRSQALIPALTGLGGALLSGDEAFVTKFNSAGAVQYSSFFGGNGKDSGVAIAVDSFGNAYIVGQSDSSNLPMVNANDTTQQNDEGFIAKIDATGSSILYSSFIGGNKKDFVAAIAVDAGGKAYVTGQTEGKDNSQFNVTSGAFQTTNSGSKQSGFFRVYDTALSGAASLLYSSFLGGSNGTGPDNGDLPSGIAIDSLGRAVIVGRTDTSDFPVTGDAYSSVNTSSGGDGATFLVVLNPGGGGSADLVYGTFFGAASSSGAIAMSGGTAVFVGTTNTNGLATTGSVQPARGGGSDGIVVCFTTGPATNTAPVLGGANALAGVLEDPLSNPGTLVSSMIAGKVTDPDAGALTGIAITGIVTTNGAWEYSLNGGTSWNAFTAPSSAVATLLNADALTRVRFVPNADFNGTVSGGLSFRAWDRTSGTAGTTANTTSNGGVTAYSSGLASADATVTSVNDAPVRTAGTVGNLTVAEDAAATSLGLGSLAYGPGGGADEAAQTLSYTVTAVPAATLGAIVLADGTTLVSAATSYSLAQLQGMQFKTAANASGGPATFSWSVTDSGGTANGGLNTVSESLSITVTSVNDAPVRTAGTVGNLTVAEDAAATSLGLGSLAYGPGGGADEAAQTLSYTVTAVPAATLGAIVLADGTTLVSAATSYSLAQLQGMQFKTAANASGGPATFSWSVTDSGGTAAILGEYLTVTIQPTIVSGLAVLPGAPVPVPPLDLITATTVIQPLPLNPAAVQQVVVSDPLNPVAVQQVAVSNTGPRRAGVIFEGADAVAPTNTADDFAAPLFTQTTGQSVTVSAATLATASFPSGERRGFALLPQLLDDSEFGLLNLQQSGTPLSLQEIERGLRSPAMLEQLDRMREEIRRDFNLERSVAITAAGATFGLSVIYVLWLIRGGILMGSYLSALPAWQVLDPLPVLERLKNPADEEDDLFEEFENSRLDALHSLRGY